MATDTTTVPNLQVDGNLNVAGNLSVSGTLPTVARTYLATDTAQIISLPLHIWRVWDAVATVLPGTSATDDLGYITGTHGTAGCYIGTSDLKTAGATTRYARCEFCLPPEYVDASAVSLRFSAGMITTVADVSATLQVSAYETSRADGSVGSNLYAGSAVDINSTTFAEKTFALSSAGLVRGDRIDIRIAIAVTDNAGLTAVIGAIRAAEVYTSIRG